MSNLFFPDDIIDSSAVHPLPKRKGKSGVICSHCHKEIAGRVHTWGNNYFDTYCWNLRFILMTGDEEELRREELRRYLAEKGMRDD